MSTFRAVLTAVLFLSAALAIFVAQTALLAVGNYLAERWSGASSTRALAVDGVAALAIVVAVVVGVRSLRNRRRVE